MLSEELERFVRKYVKSLSTLEILLLIHRTRVRSWTADELNRELRSSVQLVAGVLANLERSGLIQRDPNERYHWRPATPELQRMVSQLEEAQATYPVSVIREIYSRHVDQIQALADAFKIKRD